MSRFRIKSPQVIHETIDGEVVIVNLETGNYYSLADTGERIWAAVERAASVDDIVAEIRESYEARGDHLEDTVGSFLEELEREGLIAPLQDEESPPIGAPTTAVSTRATFSVPVLQKFTDMQELILLDPVHEIQEVRGQPHPKTAR